MSTKFARALSAFAGDKHGNVAITFGLMSIAMFMCMGLAIDMGRWLNAKQTTIAAMDSAVLAGGRALQINPNDTAGALAVAQKYYVENTKTRISVLRDTVTYVTGDGGKSLVAEGNAWIKTTIMGLGGIEELPLLDTSGTEYSKAQLATGGNATINLEVSMMLDITGSMSGQKIIDMKEAAKDLIDIVVFDDQSKYTSKVALVPFSQAVNLGSNYFTPITNELTDTQLAKLEVAPSAGEPKFAMLDYLRSFSFIETAHAKKWKKKKT